MIATMVVLKVGLYSAGWFCDMYRKTMRFSWLRDAARIFTGEASGDVKDLRRWLSSAKGLNRSTTMS